MTPSWCRSCVRCRQKAVVGHWSNIVLEYIPSRFVNYYRIHECDGLETLEIDYDAYIIDSAKVILRDAQLTKSERIARALAVLNAKGVLANTHKHPSGNTPTPATRIYAGYAL
jgi:hypothetical protein